MRKKRLFLYLLFLLTIIIIPLGVKAYHNLKQNTIYINENETIDGNLYFLSESAIINGNVNGDIIGITQNLEINGRVEGDILSISQTFKFTGEVVGNIRIISNQVNISGIIRRNFNVLASDLFLTESAQIYWDTLIAVNNADIRSVINGNLYGLVNIMFLNAKIDKNVNLKIKDQAKNLGTLSLGERLEINGNLNYEAKEPAKISPDSIIKGEVKQTEPKPKKTINYLWSLVFKIFSTILIALVLIQLFKPALRKMTKNMIKKPSKTFLWGFFLTFILPIILIILAVTIIGLKLSIILFLFWLILILIANIITAFLLGRLITNYLLKKPNTNYIWKMIIGIVICWSLFSLPIVGLPIAIIATIWGSGAIYLQLKTLIK